MLLEDMGCSRERCFVELRGGSCIGFRMAECRFDGGLLKFSRYRFDRLNEIQV